MLNIFFKVILSEFKKEEKKDFQFHNMWQVVKFLSHTYFDTFLSQCKIYYKKMLSQDFYCPNNNCHKKILTFVSVMKL